MFVKGFEHLHHHSHLITRMKIYHITFLVIPTAWDSTKSDYSYWGNSSICTTAIAVMND